MGAVGIVGSGEDRGNGDDWIIVVFVASLAVDVTIGNGDFIADPLCNIWPGECGDLKPTHGVCKDFISGRAVVAGVVVVVVVVVIIIVVKVGLFGDGATDEATVVTVNAIEGAALLTLITGAGIHEALIEIGDVIGTFAVNVCEPCAGNVGMIFPVAKMFCCSMKSRCRA